MQIFRDTAIVLLSPYIRASLICPKRGESRNLTHSAHTRLINFLMSLCVCRALVRDSAQALAQGMRADGMSVSETAASLEWLSGHATRDCPEPCQALYEHAKRIWADPSTQAFFKRHRHNQVGRKNKSLLSEDEFLIVVPLNLVVDA